MFKCPKKKNHRRREANQSPFQGVVRVEVRQPPPMDVRGEDSLTLVSVYLPILRREKVGERGLTNPFSFLTLWKPCHLACFVREGSDFSPRSPCISGSSIVNPELPETGL